MRTCKIVASIWKFKTGDHIVERSLSSRIKSAYSVEIVAKGPFVHDGKGVIDSYVVRHGNILTVLERSEVDKNFKHSPT